MADLITAVDHVDISTADLDAAAADYQALLGRPERWHGRCDGEPAVLFELPNVAVLLRRHDRDTGLSRLGFRVSNAGSMRRRLERLRLPTLETSGADPLQLAAPASPAADIVTVDPAATRSVPVRFVARPSSSTEAAPASPAAVHGLDHVVISTGDAERAAALYGARLGLDMRLDLTRPDWGVRLMFFRCGDAVIEIAAGALEAADGAGATAGPDADRLYGLSWRVADADAARQRLAVAGFDVSEVRAGRRPGTRVFTVRSRTAAVPTLMIQPPG